MDMHFNSTLLKEKFVLFLNFGINTFNYLSL